MPSGTLNFAVGEAPALGFFEAYGTWMGTPPPTWDDIAWLRAQWDGPFMVKGFGRECATQLGLIGRSVDVGHDGPDLLDLLSPESPVEDACDGSDRPADR